MFRNIIGAITIAASAASALPANLAYEAAQAAANKGFRSRSYESISKVVNNLPLVSCSW